MSLRQAAVYVITPVKIGDYVSDPFAPDERMRIIEFLPNGLFRGTRVGPTGGDLGEEQASLGRMVLPRDVTGTIERMVQRKLLSSDMFEGPKTINELRARGDSALTPEQYSKIPVVCIPVPTTQYVS